MNQLAELSRVERRVAAKQGHHLVIGGPFAFVRRLMRVRLWGYELQHFGSIPLSRGSERNVDGVLSSSANTLLFNSIETSGQGSARMMPRPEAWRRALLLPE